MVNSDASGNLCVAFAPGLPGSMILFAGGGNFVGVDGANNTVVQPFGTNGIRIPWQEYVGSTSYNSGNPNSVINDYLPGNSVNPNNAITRAIRSARTVSYGMRVKNTTPALYAAGQAVCTRVTQSPGQRWMAVADTKAYKSSTGSGQTAYKGSVLPVRYLNPGSLSYSSLSSVPDATRGEAARPCSLIGMTGEEHPFIPVNHIVYADGAPQLGQTDTTVPVGYLTMAPLNANTTPPIPQTLVADTIAEGQVTWANLVSPPAGNWAPSGEFWSDDSADLLVYSGAGLIGAGAPTGATATFEVEVALCIECEVNEVVSIDRQHVRPTPAAQPQVLKVVAEASKQLPASVDAHNSPSLWSQLAKVGGTIGGIVSSLGIPIVSTIGGLASVALNAISGSV